MLRFQRIYIPLRSLVLLIGYYVIQQYCVKFITAPLVKFYLT